MQSTPKNQKLAELLFQNVKEISALNPLRGKEALPLRGKEALPPRGTQGHQKSNLQNKDY